MKHVISAFLGLWLIGLVALPGAHAYSVPGIHYESFAELMTGMEVRVNDGAPVSWGPLNSSVSVDYKNDGTLVDHAWGASGNGWTLSLPESIDTMNLYAIWTLTVTSGTISSLSISGLPGNTVFDVSPQPANYQPLPQDLVSEVHGNTPGSEDGIALDYNGVWPYSTGPSYFENTYGGSVTFDYLNFVQLGSAPALGDLYADLKIFFDSDLSATDGKFHFWADTDHVVPEPGTFVLLGAGLLGLLGVRSRMKRH